MSISEMSPHFSYLGASGLFEQSGRFHAISIRAHFSLPLPYLSESSSRSFSLSLSGSSQPTLFCFERWKEGKRKIQIKHRKVLFPCSPFHPRHFSLIAFVFHPSSSASSFSSRWFFPLFGRKRKKKQKLAQKRNYLSLF